MFVSSNIRFVWCKFSSNNKVNNKKKNFYKSKVVHVKEENSKMWWKEVRRLCGAQCFSGNVTSQIQVEGVENLSANKLVNVINEAFKFLEPLEEYRLPLAQLPLDEDSMELTVVSELRIYKLLTKLNPSKACGPDEIPNWMLKEYAEILAFPISRISSTSL